MEVQCHPCKCSGSSIIAVPCLLVPEQSVLSLYTKSLMEHDSHAPTLV